MVTVGKDKDGSREQVLEHAVARQGARPLPRLGLHPQPCLCPRHHLGLDLPQLCLEIDHLEQSLEENYFPPWR